MKPRRSLAARLPKTFVTVPGAGHNDLIDHGVYDRIWGFLGLRTSPPVEPAPLR